MNRAEREERNEKMREYKALGHTMKEVAEKFNLNTHTVQQICKGIAPVKREVIPANKGILKPEYEVAEDIERRLPDFEFAGNYTGTDGKVDLRCRKCGTIITRSMISVRHKNVRCRICEQKRIAQRKAEKEAEKRQRQIEQIEHKRETVRQMQDCGQIEISIHACPVCGKFTLRPVYCSEACLRKASNTRHEARRRHLVARQMVDRDITLDALYKRDNGICYICGGKCNRKDFTIKNGQVICGDWYPSIDHVTPLSRGGAHAWGNVRLAHRLCNSIKSDKIVER